MIQPGMGSKSEDIKYRDPKIAIGSVYETLASSSNVSELKNIARCRSIKVFTNSPNFIAKKCNEILC